MSHKKEERKEEETTTRSSSTVAAEQERQQEIFNESLDETKDNIRRTTDAAIKEVPRYTKVLMIIKNEPSRQPEMLQQVI